MQSDRRRHPKEQGSLRFLLRDGRLARQSGDKDSDAREPDDLFAAIDESGGDEANPPPGMPQ